MADLRETIMVALERAEGMGTDGGIAEVLRTLDEAGLAIVPRKITEEMDAAAYRLVQVSEGQWDFGTIWAVELAAWENQRG